MTTTARPTALRRPAPTRALLLRAALESFAAHGYEGTTLDALSAAAGFTKGACYVYVPD